MQRKLHIAIRACVENSIVGINIHPWVVVQLLVVVVVQLLVVGVVLMVIVGVLALITWLAEGGSHYLGNALSPASRHSSQSMPVLRTVQKRGQNVDLNMGKHLLRYWF